MAHRNLGDHESDGWERSDFPIIGDSTLNPSVRMPRAEVGYESDTIVTLRRTTPLKIYARKRPSASGFCNSEQFTRGHEMPSQNINSLDFRTPKFLAKASMGTLEPPEDKCIKTLLVGGLNPRVVEQDIRVQFSAYGEIESIDFLVEDGRAFVTYTTREGAEKATQDLSKCLVINGQRLTLAWGRPRPVQDSAQFEARCRFLSQHQPGTTPFMDFVSASREVSVPSTGASSCTGASSYPCDRKRQLYLPSFSGWKQPYEMPSQNINILDFGTEFLAKDSMATLEPPEDKSIKTLLVRGINPRVVEQDIRVQFSAYGEIEHIDFLAEERRAFVTYTTREGAEKATQELSKCLVINGQRLTLAWGRPRPVQDSAQVEARRRFLSHHQRLIDCVGASREVSVPSTGASSCTGASSYPCDRKRQLYLPSFSGWKRPYEMPSQNINILDFRTPKFLAKASMGTLEPPEDKCIKTLLVGGLNQRVVEQDIRVQFSAYGEIESINFLVEDGRAFVTYTTREGAEKATQELSKCLVINGQRLTLAWGRPRPVQDSAQVEARCRFLSQHQPGMDFVCASREVSVPSTGASSYPCDRKRQLDLPSKDYGRKRPYEMPSQNINSHDGRKRPFEMPSQNINILDLGTEFLAKACMATLEPPEDKSIKTLLVRGINSRVVEQDIRVQFSAYGEIEHIDFLAEERRAFVTYTTREGAEKATQELSKWLVTNGQRLTLAWGRPRPFQDSAQVEARRRFLSQQQPGTRPLMLFLGGREVSVPSTGASSYTSDLQRQLFLPSKDRKRNRQLGLPSKDHGRKRPFEVPSQNINILDFGTEFLAKDSMATLEPPEDKSIKTLLVRGINSRVVEQDIRVQFSAYGEIEHIDFLAEERRAFVTYTTREGAEKATQELSNCLVTNGQRLTLAWGRPRPFQDSAQVEARRRFLSQQQPGTRPRMLFLGGREVSVPSTGASSYPCGRKRQLTLPSKDRKRLRQLCLPSKDRKSIRSSSI